MDTQLTKLLNLSNPIMVAGMGHITGPDLAAAVTNAGGIGTIGAIPLDADSYGIKVNENNMDNYKNFFNKSYAESIEMKDDILTIKNTYADPVSFNVVDFG